jgi:translation initiation factor IF-2
MNISELARILRITPNELLDKLPQLGFDIGRRAIKIDNTTARKIIREWSDLNRKLANERAKEQQKDAAAENLTAKEKKIVTIPKLITVRELAALAEVPVNKVLAELMKNSIFVSLNEKIDYDTAWLVGSELGLDVKPSDENEISENKNAFTLKDIMDKENESDLRERPPVIVVMGHVDHGKTKLLDSIRRTNVVEGEAGGITQHIGAYQVVRRNRLITFIDTPGHEAFTAMRSRGAKVADIAILVVAADDGVKPQTVEAYRIIEAVKLPFIVAINKIDKPEANIDNVKQELSNQLGITPEDWGGKTVCALVSAKDEKGIIELLDTVLLIADLETKNIRSNPMAVALGTVVESRVDKGSGPIATILIQNGTLRVGDQLCLNQTSYGKVRALQNYKGESVNEAVPSMPVKIIGLRALPEVGDILMVGDGDRSKIKKSQEMGGASKVMDSAGNEDESIKKINYIIKSDFYGSAEAIEESLEKLNSAKAKIKIIHKGLGNITDGDIKRAEATGSRIAGFNVKVAAPIQEMARERGVDIKIYKIIYDLINEAKADLADMIEPDIRRVEVGKIKVMAIFRTENKFQIVGGKVIEGQAESNVQVEVMRGSEIIDTGKLSRLQAGKQDVSSVEQGQECGLQYEGKPVIKPDDVLRLYKEEKVTGHV